MVFPKNDADNNPVLDHRWCEYDDLVAHDLVVELSQRINTSHKRGEAKRRVYIVGMDKDLHKQVVWTILTRDMQRIDKTKARQTLTMVDQTTQRATNKVLETASNEARQENAAALQHFRDALSVMGEGLMITIHRMHRVHGPSRV